MKSITVLIPDEDLKILKQLIDTGLYPNVAECIRVALRDYLWEKLEKIK
ncbi:MAG: ribbon-helix-helix domain-containing protein [Candidatus Helarchaeota archaeon]